MARFIPPSERFGLRPPIPQQKRDEASVELRQDIVNDFMSKVVPHHKDVSRGNFGNPYRTPLLEMLWTDAHRRPYLQFPPHLNYRGVITELLMECDPVGFYDWTGYVHHGTREYPAFDDWGTDIELVGDWKAICNDRFEQHKCAWRFVGDELVPVSGPEEVASLEAASERVAASARTEKCRAHFHSALRCFASRDYPNTGKEAISALESLAQIATRRSKPLGELASEFVKLAGLHATHVPVHGGAGSREGLGAPAPAARHAS